MYFLNTKTSIYCKNASQDSEWIWVATNETMYYTNWEDEEPSNSNFGEYCLEMLGNGKWNDIDCNGFFGIYRRPICQLF